MSSRSPLSEWDPREEPQGPHIRGVRQQHLAELLDGEFEVAGAEMGLADQEPDLVPLGVGDRHEGGEPIDRLVVLAVLDVPPRLPDGIFHPHDQLQRRLRPGRAEHEVPLRHDRPFSEADDERRVGRREALHRHIEIVQDPELLPLVHHAAPLGRRADRADVHRPVRRNRNQRFTPLVRPGGHREALPDGSEPPDVHRAEVREIDRLDGLDIVNTGWDQFGDQAEPVVNRERLPAPGVAVAQHHPARTEIGALELPHEAAEDQRLAVALHIRPDRPAGGDFAGGGAGGPERRAPETQEERRGQGRGPEDAGEKGAGRKGRTRHGRDRLTPARAVQTDLRGGRDPRGRTASSAAGSIRGSRSAGGQRGGRGRPLRGLRPRSPPAAPGWRPDPRCARSAR